MADAGFKLSVEGEKEFKQAIENINAQIKANKAELKLLTAEYDQNADGLSNFTRKQDALRNAMDAQEQKVNALKEHYNELAKQYDENDTRMINMKARITEEAAQFAKLQAAIVDNEKAMEEYNSDAEDFRKEFEQIGDSVEENRKKLSDLGKAYSGLSDSSGDAYEKQKNLREQNELMNDSITKQRQLMEKLNDELSDAEKLFGKNSNEAEDFRKKIEKAADEVDNMEKQIEENNQALKDSGNASDGLLGSLEKIEELTGVQIPDGIKKMIGSSGAGGFLGAAGAAGAIVAGLAAALDEAKKITDWADDMVLKSQEMSVDVEQYQALEFAASKLGVSMDAVQDAIKEINNRMGESDKIVRETIGSIDNLSIATDEQKKSIHESMKQFTDLGVAIYDTSGELRTAEDLFYELIDAYGKITNDTERAYKMNDMFGESYRRLNPMVEAGTDTIKKYEEQARELGIVMDEETVYKLDKAANKWEEFGLRTGAAWRNFKANLDIKEWLVSSPIKGLLNTIEAISEAGKTIFSGLFSPGGSIPAYATGTYNYPGGWSLVGEKGPEIVQLPQGSRIYPNGTYPGSGNVTNHYDIQIDAKSVKEFNDIVRIVESASRISRMR